MLIGVITFNYFSCSISNGDVEQPALGNMLLFTTQRSWCSVYFFTPSNICIYLFFKLRRGKSLIHTVHEWKYPVKFLIQNVDWILKNITGQMERWGQWCFKPLVNATRSTRYIRTFTIETRTSTVFDNSMAYTATYQSSPTNNVQRASAV